MSIKFVQLQICDTQCAPLKNTYRSLLPRIPGRIYANGFIEAKNMRGSTTLLVVYSNIEKYNAVSLRGNGMRSVSLLKSSLNCRYETRRCTRFSIAKARYRSSCSSGEHPRGMRVFTSFLKRHQHYGLRSLLSFWQQTRDIS